MRTRRFKKEKKPRKIFLIICEGETEREYVESLRLHYRVPITIKTRISGTKINQRLISQYISELGLSKEDEYRTFLVYDADVSHIVEKLTQLDGTLILSNPCIELWFILHVKDYRKSQESPAIVKELISSHSIWSNYTKGKLSAEQSSYLMTNKHKASARAQNLTWGKNPYSNMHCLIEALEKQRTD